MREPKGRVLAFSADGSSRQVELAFPVPALAMELRQAVQNLAGEAGLLVMQALIAEEVEQWAGGRHGRSADRRAHRWGQEEGYVVLGGGKVAMKRPRVRRCEGGEVDLQRYRLFQSDGELQRKVVDRVLTGVSTRNYERVVDDVCEGYGIRKSSVSRHWKAASAEQLQTLLERRLEELDLAVLMIDGITFQDPMFVVALGIDTAGRKHVLGLWQGASENAEVCQGLLDDLIRRGLARDRSYLFVLDGSKALSKAVRKTFGSEAPIQRCQVHKERNVVSHLPDRYEGEVRRALRAAWGMKGYAEARQALEDLVRRLEGLNPSAAASLREGLEETLTLHGLGVPAGLRKTLRSTNPIENAFSSTRHLSRNVKRWCNSDQARRWAATCLLEAEKRFRRVDGYRAMPVLLSALGRLVDREKAVG